MKRLSIVVLAAVCASTFALLGMRRASAAADPAEARLASLIQPNLRIEADGRTRPLFEDEHVAGWASDTLQRHALEPVWGALRSGEVPDRETFLVRPLIDLKVSESQGAAIPKGKRRFVVEATVWLGAPSAPESPRQVVYRGVGQADVDGAYDSAQATIVAHNMRFGHMADEAVQRGVSAALDQALDGYVVRVGAVAKAKARLVKASEPLEEYTPANLREEIEKERRARHDLIWKDEPRAYPESAKGWIDGPALR